MTLMTGGGGGGVIQVNYDELDLNDKEHIYRMIFILIIPEFKICLMTYTSSNIHGPRTLNKNGIKIFFLHFFAKLPLKCK